MLLRRPVGTRRGPGLLGSVARTAVVAGTATATAGAVHRWSERRQAEAAEVRAAQQAVHDQQLQLDDQVQAERQAERGEPQAQPLGQAPGVDLMSQLRQLADLRAAGVLTDAEFTAAKAKLLGT
ncbi:SHOCT domain-containing protein [Catellatospora sp. NPDC049111]|uniref:SHOCT domain-containing protein n=1 Tax=Catellatospora sp. NPDC049111 TaxID=3155271 RepID=UPI0033DFA95B